MNTTPAYILQLSYPVQIGRNKSYTFRDGNLLTARQTTLLKAQQLMAAKRAHEVADFLIQLVEIDRSTVSNKHRVIATVFSQRLNRSSYISDEGHDLLVGMDRNSLVARSLPDSIFLTIGLERSNEDGNSLEVIEKALTADELAYYQQQGYVTNLPQHQE